MQKLLIFLGLIVFFSACKNNSDSPSDRENGSLEEAPSNLIEPALLEQAKIRLATIDSDAFNAIPSSASNNAKALCEKSKGYKSNTWEGLNDCSWVMEKEQILKHKELVSRNGQQLSLKIGEGVQNFENKTQDAAQSTFYQFKNYLASSKYFLIEEHVTGKCPHTKIIKEIDASEHRLKGIVSPSPNGLHFLTYSAENKANIRCNNQLQCYSFTTEGLHKNWHLPLKDKIIQELKYSNDKDVYISLLSNNKGKDVLNYLHLSW